MEKEYNIFKDSFRFLPASKSGLKYINTIREYLYKKIFEKNNYELLKLLKKVIKNINQCNIPVLIFKSASIQRISIKNLKDIYRRVLLLKK